MPSRMFLCRCARCCDVGEDGVARNPGSKETPIALKNVHLLQAANIASSPEREASVLCLARQLQPPGSLHATNLEASFPQYESDTSMAIDDIAAELFAITLSDNDADPDSHSKLWVSRSEVQQDRAKASNALADVAAGLTPDDTQ